MMNKALARFRHFLLLSSGLGTLAFLMAIASEPLVNAMEFDGRSVSGSSIPEQAATPPLASLPGSLPDPLEQQVAQLDNGAIASNSLDSSSPTPRPFAFRPQTSNTSTQPTVAPQSDSGLTVLSNTPTTQINLQIAQASPTQVAQAPRIAINTDSNNLSTQPSIVDPFSTPNQLPPNWLSASFPVENFQTYTSPFGYRQSPDGSYGIEFHYGLDLAAPEGSYIRNWWTGTVVEVSDDSNCGTSVVIESGPWLHIYCHMQGHVESNAQGRYMIDRNGGLQIFEGHVVVAGERIGRIGMTGRTTGPHLHWGLRYNEDWVDPALVLRAMYQSQQTAMQQPQ